MLGEDLSRALSNISDDKIEAAANMAPASRRHIWLRVAAVAAVVAILLTWLLWPVEDENFVTGPGLLVVRAHAVDEYSDILTEEVVLEDGVEFAPMVRFDQDKSLVQHITFKFSVDESLYSDMKITMELKTDAGIFYSDDYDGPPITPEMPVIMQMFQAYSGQHFTTDIDTCVGWIPFGFDYDHMRNEIEKGNLDSKSAYKPFCLENNPSFIDVIIWADDIIVGYCVIEIQEINGITGSMARDFSFEVLTMVSFPKVDGKWQDVTRKYVQENIKQIHNESEKRGTTSDTETGEMNPAE